MWALLIGGIAFLVAEWHLRGKKPGTEITWTIAVAVAIGQLIAGTLSRHVAVGERPLFSACCWG